MKKTFLATLAILVLLTTCKRETNENSFFLHVFTSAQNSACLYISPSDNNGFVIISSSPNADGTAINVHQVNASGQLQSTLTLPDTFYRPQITDLEDGTLLVNSYSYYPKMIRIDQKGNILFRSSLKSAKAAIGYSPAIRGEDGNYYVSQSNGWFTSGSSTNFVRRYQWDGKYLSNRQIPDAVFGGKISDVFIYRYEKPEIYYLLGTIYPNSTVELNNPRLFVSKIEFTGNSITKKKTTILDPQNNWALNYYNTEYLLTDDKQLILCMSQIVETKTTEHVYKVDENFNTEWDFSFTIPGYNINTISTIRQCPDANYLLCGSCETDTKYLTQPFACKISPDGKIIWTKILPMNSASSFGSARQLQNGSCIFGGTSGSFGNGKTLNDIFMLKTDKDGNLK